MKLSNLAANAQAKALADLLVGGYIDLVAGEDRLARSNLAAVPFGSPQEGIIKANAIAPSVAVATGEPTGFRICTKEGAVVIEGGREAMNLQVDMVVKGTLVRMPEYVHRVVKDD
jgi:hypothetical protein